MIDQGMLGDAAMFEDGIVEEESSFEEPITIRRFLSRPSTPGVFQTAQNPQFTDFQATAAVVSQQVAAELFKAGILQVGDLVLQMRDRLNEGSMNIGGTQLADRVVWRGAEYRMVQRTEPVRVGGDDVFYHALLRRTNSTADTVGA